VALLSPGGRGRCDRRLAYCVATVSPPAGSYARTRRALRDAGRLLAADHATRSLVDRREPVVVSRPGGAQQPEDFHEWSFRTSRARRRAHRTQGRRPLAPESFFPPTRRREGLRCRPEAPSDRLSSRCAGRPGSVTNDLPGDRPRRRGDPAHPTGPTRRRVQATAAGLPGASADPLRAYVYSEGIVHRPGTLNWWPAAGPRCCVTGHTALHLGTPPGDRSGPAQEDVGGRQPSPAGPMRPTGYGEACSGDQGAG
jgi:hypothetical protein